MAVFINDAKVVITQAGGEEDRTENGNNSFSFLDEMPGSFMARLHTDGGDLIILSDICFHGVTGTP